MKADLEDLGRDPEEPSKKSGVANQSYQYDPIRLFGYKVIQASKERSFAQKVVQQAIDHTFWYHSKAQECVGFNALFDPTYENP